MLNKMGLVDLLSLFLLTMSLAACQGAGRSPAPRVAQGSPDSTIFKWVRVVDIYEARGPTRFAFRGKFWLDSNQFELRILEELANDGTPYVVTQQVDLSPSEHYLLEHTLQCWSAPMTVQSSHCPWLAVNTSVTKLTADGKGTEFDVEQLAVLFKRDLPEGLQAKEQMVLAFDLNANGGFISAEQAIQQAVEAFR